MWLLYLDLITRISFIFSLIMSAVIIMYNPFIPFYFYPLFIFLSFLSYILKNIFNENLKFLSIIPYLAIVIIPVGIYEKILILINFFDLSISDLNSEGSKLWSCCGSF